MLYSDLYGKLIILTKRNDITHVEIGKCINLEKGAIVGRAKRNSNMKSDEIEKIGNVFGVDISSLVVYDNSLNPQNDNSVQNKVLNFNNRLTQIQNKSGLSDYDFAKLLGFYRDEYLEFKYGERKPNLNILLALKQNFQLSLDWLILGD